MIPKGSQRAGGQQLATHLLNEFDNDRVEVAEVRGAIAEDLHGAFDEWSATAKGTRCRKYLYSLSVNPDPEQEPLTREQYRDFVERAEKKLGLTGQPRALIFHVKHGREHCHVVWSRIDTAKMRAVQISHDRHKLRSVVLDFARDHGLALPRGVTRDRAKDSKPRRRAENLAEKQQEERTGQTRKHRIRTVTEAWNKSHDGKGLVRALEERGYLLARGNRRAYVVVDRFGEIHSLARQIKGVRSREVKARLASYPLDQLPDAKKAQEFAREQRESLSPEEEREKEKERIQAEARQRREELAAAHAERRARVDRKRAALQEQHRRERETLREMQDAANRGIAEKREASRPKGVLAFLTRITGIRAITQIRERRQDEQRREEHRRQTAALQRRHKREMQDFSRHYRALTKVEAREKRSLRTALRREEFARIARGPAPPKPPVPPLTPTFGKAAADDRAQGPPPDLTPDFNESAEPPKSPEPPKPITPAFDKAATPPEPPARDRSTGGLSPDFNRKASGEADPEAPERKKDSPTSEPRPDADPERPEDGSLSETFERALRERAERKRKEQERDRGPGKPRGPGRDRGL